MTTAKINLLDYDRNGLREAFAALGEKPYRAEQVMKWIYHRHVTDFASMTDLGKALREKLENAAEIVPPKTLFETQASDATYKWLLGMDGGNAIETVFIPETSRGTLCVSSQVGCGLNCSFCSTGTQGFNRNLSAAEIVGQVWVAAKHLGNVPHHQRKLTNVVMMGMGEPLLNFDNVVTAMSVMRDDLGFGLANKRVTLSTAGASSHSGRTYSGNSTTDLSPNAPGARRSLVGSVIVVRLPLWSRSSNRYSIRSTAGRGSRSRQSAPSRRNRSPRRNPSSCESRTDDKRRCRSGSTNDTPSASTSM